MNEDLYEAISRLKAWIRDYGAEKSPVFIGDLETVIDALTPGTAAKIGVSWDGISAVSIAAIQNACSCHERDGSFVCEFCRSQGLKGYMQ
jgi:hypothetical protein